MILYTLRHSSRARSDLQRLDPTIRQRIGNKLEWLCENCDNRQHKALKGKHRGKFTLKINDYRALYTFDSRTKVVTVHEIGHRSNVY